MPAAILPALSAIGAALATPTGLMAAGTVGSALIGANAAKGQANAQMESARIASSGQRPSTPVGALIAPQAAMPGATSNTSAPIYGGGGNRYNSAQQLSTAPSLVGTGSGFNAASAKGQPQPGEEGKTGL